jgi:hypothetical protein
MESNISNKGVDDNIALIGQTKKGRGKGPNKVEEKSEDSSSHPRKKDLIKIK